ncbi:adenine methyltransferase [Candidatus Dependentiae bacterium]|nr:MAG: adenine methyltransferase [Candidatus Dependentiae bacterium]
MSKKYNIIYADPAWSYKTYKRGSGNGNVLNHYETMTIHHIKSLPVEDIAAEDCVLFLWVTFPCLEQGLETIKAWGFKYKTVAFTWVKKNKKSNSWFWGLGHWTRANAEICLLATKGKPSRASKGVHSIIDTPIEKHSQKPSIVRDKIIELMGGGSMPKIELFAREKIKGWDVWGNEIKSDIDLEGLNL